MLDACVQFKGIRGHAVVGDVESPDGALERRVDVATRSVCEIDEPLEGEVRIDLVVLIDGGDYEVEQAVLDPRGDVESLREVPGPRREDLRADFDGTARAPPPSRPRAAGRRGG